MWGCLTIRADTVQYAKYSSIPDSLGKESANLRHWD